MNNNKIIETETCIICYDKIIQNIDQLKFDNCNHGNNVHLSCIKKWNNTCPICRENIYKPQNNYNIINNLINIIFNQYNNNINISTFIITTR